MRENISERNGFEIAITGMSGRFPGANNIDELWENIKNGVHSIRFFSDEELSEKDNFDPGLLKLSNFIKAKGIIDNVEYFDAYFFGYSPNEAEILEPQIRIFHEICWEALEDAACDPSTFGGAIGVFAGGSMNRSWPVLAVMSGKAKNMGEFVSDSLIDKDVLSTRTSYKLDLKGPSISLNTACSTALTAVDLACRSLLTGQCDVALAGAASVMTQYAKGGGYIYEEGVIHSPDGYVRTFDAGARGTVFSDGAGVVLLKRLDDALAGGDHIYAVIKSFCSNNDGIGKSSFTAPTITGQTAVIKAALYMAEVEPESITYVEAHGTGTEIGDPIEIEALTRAFGTDKRNYCAVGSIKTNIGHLDVAAGAAAIIKTAFMIEKRMIPPSLNFEKPNPKIDFENSPFFVPRELKEWKSNGSPIRAGVSSFGVGGTNVHVILEEAPPGNPASPPHPYELIMLSARSAKALDQATANFVDYLKANPDVELADVAFTLKTGRKAFEHRRILVCEDLTTCLQGLSAGAGTEWGDSTEVKSSYSKEKKRAVLMFPGQGSQYINMARGIYENEPIFREEMDRCFDILKQQDGLDIKHILYPTHAAHAPSEPLDGNPPGSPLPGRGAGDSRQGGFDSEASPINQTRITQPVLFAIEYALAKLLMCWGIEPYAMIGHSIGEYTAACLAGVFSLEDALAVVAWRGKLMQQMPPGDMLSVSLPETGLQSLLTNNLAIAAVNGPTNCVVSGTHDDIKTFARLLEEKNIQHRLLHTSHAFHSQMMDAMVKPFAEKVAQVNLNEPKIPFISNVTGTWITYDDALDPQYWAKHVRSAVRFADGAGTLLKEQNALFIEVGPGRTLNTFIKQHPSKQQEHKSVNLIRHPNEDINDELYLLKKLGETWLYGVPITWNNLYEQEKRHRLRLPTYPFQRQAFWLEGNPVTMFQKGLGGQFVPGKNPEIKDWFYIPTWKRSIVPAKKQEEPGTESGNSPRWLVFAHENSFSSRLTKAIVQEKPGQEQKNVTVVRCGQSFSRSQAEARTYCLSPGKAGDYQALIDELEKEGNFPTKIVHLWNISDEDTQNTEAMEKRNIEAAMNHGFYSLLYLAQALGKHEIKEKIDITALTNGMQEVWDEKVLYPEKAVALGPLMVIPREYPEVDCRCIDIALPEPGGENEEKLVQRLLKEFNATVVPGDELIAYRDNRRYVKIFVPTPFAPPPADTIQLKKEGVYLITGGLGGIGFELSRYLASAFQAKIILTGRSAFPPRKEWDNWLDSHSSLDSTSKKIRKVKELESFGSEVSVYTADVTDEDGMHKVVEEVCRKYEAIHGVIHAAGLPGGGLIQIKTQDIAESVLSPKIKGTFTLEKVLKTIGIELDFFVLCSSVGSVIPQLGQVDYFSANAFMDAFAHYKSAKGKTITVSINWDAWQEVGMAVEAAKQFAGEKYNEKMEPREMEHPLFDYYVTTASHTRAATTIFTSFFSLNRHWVLKDHMSPERKGVVPGVTYLEMAYAALRNLLAGSDKKSFLQIRDVAFIKPLMAGEDEEKEVQTILKQDGEVFKFLVRSRIKAGENAWQDHAKGEILQSHDPGEEAVIKDLKAIEKRCDLGEIDIEARKKEKVRRTLVIFGPRWNNMARVMCGHNEALAHIKLPAEFLTDLSQYTLHPSMLDNATSFLNGQMDRENAYIPFSYGKVKVFYPFTPDIFVYARLVGEGDGKLEQEFLKFNITIMDKNGTVLSDIEEFTMLEISNEVFTRLKNIEQGAVFAGHEEVTQAEQSREPGNLTQGLVEDGIAPSEGIDVFTRILSEELPQVVVSTRDLEARIAASRLTADTDTVLNMDGNTIAGPAHERPDISTSYTEPANETEQKMANIWQELLGIEQIGVNDDFFELGGDSLKAMTVRARIEKALDVEMPLSEFFKYPTIRKLAGNMTVAVREGYRVIESVEDKEYYPLSSSQGRLYVLHRMSPGDTNYNLPRVYLLEGKINRNLLEDVFKYLIERHESLRTSFFFSGGEAWQKIHATVDFNIEYCNNGGPSSKRDSMDEQAVIRDFIRPFDLKQVPLLRVKMIKKEENLNLLMMDMHHIVTDGNSSALFIKEFINVYAKWSREPGKQYRLPRLKLRYRDYVRWLESKEEKDRVMEQRKFWKDEFLGEVPVLNLSYDYPRPAIQSFKGGTIEFIIDRERTKGLKEAANRKDATLYMILMAIFNILLAKLSGQEDVIIGTPELGRPHVDLGPLIGVFINTLALRNYPVGNKL